MAWRLWVLVAWLWPAAWVWSAPLELVAGVEHVSATARMAHCADADNALSFEAIRQRDFTPRKDFRSLGYNTAAHWFRFELNRSADAPRQWVLAIGRPYLEEVDVWVSRPDGGFHHHALGKYRSGDGQALAISPFAVVVDLDGPVTVFVRVHSTNPIIVTADLWQPKAFAESERRGTLYLGLNFGILLIAAVLYAVLGGWLRDGVMATYAGYVVSLALMIHGDILGLFAADAPWMDDVLTRMGWLGSSVFLVLMWDRLLALKTDHPRVHRLFMFTILLDLALLPFALMPSMVNGAVLMAVKAANILNSANFFISMALVLWGWWHSRRTVLLLYFVAFLIPAAGTLLNTAASQGGVPLNMLTVNIAHLAPLVHVFVMSAGLALRLRQVQQDKAAAQQEVAVATRRAEEQRRFVAMLSHEFRNPLAAIDRSAQMIQIKVPDLPPVEAQRLAGIRGNAATLSGFVDNFLMTEALDHGGLALAREPHAIRSLLEAAVRMQGDGAAERVRLAVTPEDAVFPLDDTMIGVAVGNLLGNALRYSPPDTPVTVNAELEGANLRIRVADRGPGLGEDDLAKLGTPYFRASTSLGMKGSGLGYHFTRRIVEAHGGVLSARSPGGAGLEVEMSLPG